MTMIEDLLTRFCGTEGLRAVDPFDHARALESDIPFVLVGLPAPDAHFLVCADGSVACLEQGYLADEIDLLTFDDPTPLHTAAARTSTFDVRQTMRTNGYTSHFIAPPRRDEIVLFALSAGARAALEAGDDLDALAACLRGDGYRPEALWDFFATLNAGLEDPFIFPSETKSWSDDQVPEIEETLMLALTADPDLEEGEISLCARVVDEEEAHVCIDGERAEGMSDRIIRILDRLHDFSAVFHGVSHEYNDGASARRSGYWEDSPTVLVFDMDPPSAHARLEASRVLRARLAAAGASQAEIDRILAA